MDLANFETGIRTLARFFDELAAGGVLTGWYSGRVSAGGGGCYDPDTGACPVVRDARGASERVSTEIEQPAVRGPKAQWRLDADTGSLAPRSALDVLVDLNDKVASGNLAEYQPVPLGFTPLDKTIGGGLRPGELLLIGGAQGTGKTTMALQMARNVASGGQANVLYICFEHDEQYLLNRLIALESALAHLPHKTGAIKIQDVRRRSSGRGWPTARRPARSWPPTRACGRPRPDRPLRPEPVPDARDADGEHGRQHARRSSSCTRSCPAVASSSSSSTTSRRSR